MKQKKITNILYVFDITPYQITEDTDAEVIKVQEECVAGFKELNESLANKIVAYNYHVMCVQVPEWAPYVDEPDPVSPELAWSANTATVTIGADDNVFPTLSNPHSVTVTYSSSDTTKATINATTGQITLLDAGNTTISAVFAGNDTYYAQTVTYTLTVQAAQKQSPELSWSAESATVTIGADDNVFPTLSNPHSVTVYYASGNESVATINESTGEITLVAEGYTTIYANNGQGDETYESQTVSYALTVEQAAVDTYTVTIDADGLTDQNTEFKINGETVTLDGSYTVDSGSYFEFWPLVSYSDFSVTGLTFDDTAGSEHWYSDAIYTNVNYVISYKG